MNGTTIFLWVMGILVLLAIAFNLGWLDLNQKYVTDYSQQQAQHQLVPVSGVQLEGVQTK